MIGALTLVSSGLAAASRTAVPSPQQQPSAEATADANYPVFLRVCGDCHDASRVTATRRTKVDWEDVINTMASKGAAGSDEDFEAVLQYVLRYYGKVNVNRCVPAELVAVLQVTQKDAEAIIAYRKDKGDFANFDALSKVPGVDVKVLEAHKDAITF
jgi:competence protein ComEA